MIRFILGFMAGGFTGYLPGQVIPPRFLLVMNILLLLMITLSSVLFHIGLCSSLKE